MVREKRIWKGDVLVADLERSWKIGCVRYPCSKVQCKGNRYAEKW